MQLSIWTHAYGLLLVRHQKRPLAFNGVWLSFVVSFAQLTRKGDRRRSLGGGEVGGACWGLRRRWIAVLGAIGGRHGAVVQQKGYIILLGYDCTYMS